MLTIRKEDTSDYKEVYALVQNAFATAEHADGTEQDLVEKLRECPQFIPELSLVACDNGKIVGHIMFTEIALGGLPALCLAPLAIHPDYQKQGIGSKLIEEGHRIAKGLGYTFSVLLGSEHYYPRFGYRRASEFGILSPFEVPDINFMALDLQGNTRNPNCTLGYAAPFYP